MDGAIVERVVDAGEGRGEAVRGSRSCDVLIMIPGMVTVTACARTLVTSA